MSELLVDEQNGNFSTFSHRRLKRLQQHFSSDGQRILWTNKKDNSTPAQQKALNVLLLSFVDFSRFEKSDVISKTANCGFQNCKARLSDTQLIIEKEPE